MIGRIWLRLTQALGRDALVCRLVQALLYELSEFEASALRPGESTLLRRAFLHTKGVRCGPRCYFSRGFRLYKTAHAQLDIGRHASIGENAGIYVHADVAIGDDFIAAPGLTINNGTHDVATLRPNATPLSIGHRVWCGVNVTIIAGARIGDDCVIGANSLVNSDIPSRTLAYGAPARVIRTDIRPVGGGEPWSGAHAADTADTP